MKATIVRRLVVSSLWVQYRRLSRVQDEPVLNLTEDGMMGHPRGRCTFTDVLSLSHRQSFPESAPDLDQGREAEGKTRFGFVFGVTGIAASGDPNRQHTKNPDFTRL